MAASPETPTVTGPVNIETIAKIVAANIKCKLGGFFSLKRIPWRGHSTRPLGSSVRYTSPYSVHFSC